MALFGLFILFCIGIIIYDTITDPHFSERIADVEE